jgi:hypothetical protein
MGVRPNLEQNLCIHCIVLSAILASHMQATTSNLKRAEGVDRFKDIGPEQEL